MLSETAALLFFVAEELPDGKPFERFLELAFTRSDHTSKRRCQLRAQSDFAFSFVCEIEKLIDNFRATLFFVQLGGLEQRAFPFHKTVPTGHFAPARKDVIAFCAVLGQEITETRQCLHKHCVTLPWHSKPVYARRDDRTRPKLRYGGVPEETPALRGRRHARWRTSI